VADVVDCDNSSVDKEQVSLTHESHSASSESVSVHEDHDDIEGIDQSETHEEMLVGSNDDCIQI
jgi:hypothetical protein